VLSGPALFGGVALVLLLAVLRSSGIVKSWTPRLDLARGLNQEGRPPEGRCPACDEVLEVFDGSRLVAYRLTVQPIDR
jgi:hypothetical protein